MAVFLFKLAFALLFAFGALSQSRRAKSLRLESQRIDSLHRASPSTESVSTQSLSSGSSFGEGQVPFVPERFFGPGLIFPQRPRVDRDARPIDGSTPMLEWSEGSSAR